MDGNTSFVARQFPQFDLRLVFKFKSQVMSSCLLHTHIYVYIHTYVSAYMHLSTYVYLWFAYGYTHTQHIHTHNTHIQTYTAYTRNALCNFFSLSSLGLLLVGLYTSTWNIYVCVNWTLGIDDMRRKIKIRKNCELWMRFMNGTDDRYTTGECKKSAFTLLN